MKPCKSISAWVAVLLGLLAGAGSARGQWDAETPLTATGSDIWGEGVAASGSTVHVVYGTSTLNYQRSTDQGVSWSAAVPIGSGTLHLTDPIVADGNDMWVVYLDAIQNMTDWCCQRDLGSVWLVRSRDGGDSWDDPVQLSASNTAFRLSIAYAANRLHLVWMDYRSGNWDTYYLRSPDRGDTWDPEAVIATSAGPFGAERPQVAARGDSVHVTIWDDRDGDNPQCMSGTYLFPKCPDVFHVRSTDAGKNWSSIVNVAHGGAGLAGRNDVAVAGSSNVIINYNVDLPGETGSKLFAVASSDDGASWAEPIRLTTSPNASDHGSIIGAGNAAYLVWHDDRDPANREIYYRRTPDGGGTWEDEEHVSSGAAGDSTTPLDAVTPDYAHVVWIDNRSGSYQLYYRRRALARAVAAPDAGVADAAVPDASAATDAATPDAGVASDAGGVAADAGIERADSGASATGGRPAPRDGGADSIRARANARSGGERVPSGGCGCRIARAQSPGGLLATGLLLVLVALRRGTTRHRRPTLSVAGRSGCSPRTGIIRSRRDVVPERVGVSARYGQMPLRVLPRP